MKNVQIHLALKGNFTQSKQNYKLKAITEQLIEKSTNQKHKVNATEVKNKNKALFIIKYC